MSGGLGLQTKTQFFTTIVDLVKSTVPDFDTETLKNNFDTLALSSISEILKFIDIMELYDSPEVKERVLNGNTAVIFDMLKTSPIKDDGGVSNLLKSLWLTKPDIFDIVRGPAKYHSAFISAIACRNNYQPDGGASSKPESYFLHMIARRIMDKTPYGFATIEECCNFLSSEDVTTLIKNHPEFLYQRDQHGHLIFQYLDLDNYLELYQLFRPTWQPHMYDLISPADKEVIVKLCSLQNIPTCLWYMLPKELMFIIVDYIVEYGQSDIVAYNNVVARRLEQIRAKIKNSGASRRDLDLVLDFNDDEDLIQLLQ